MILVQTVFQAKFGKAGELAGLVRDLQSRLGPELGFRNHWRVLTDLSGAFDTVVLEVEAASLAEWEQLRPRLFAVPAFRESFARMAELTASGSNAFWTIEGES
jgi:hypothetical protein